METSSFSHVLSNLLIGLSKGSLTLQPFSLEFRDELGYKLFRLEASFKLALGGRSNPDMILISERVANSLLFEWTAADAVGDHKKGQFERYSKISGSDLISVLAIPQAAARTHDVVLVAMPAAMGPFQQYFCDRGWGCPMLSFALEDAVYCLAKAANAFAESATDGFFTRGVRVNRVPLRYLPFSIDQISAREIVTPIVRHLISLVIKGTEETSIGEFCAGFVPVWAFIDGAKQNELARAARLLLDDLARRSLGRELLSRAADNPRRWRLIANVEFKRRMRSFRRFLAGFIDEHQGRVSQPELPLDEP